MRRLVHYKIDSLDDMRYVAETWSDDIPGIEIFIIDKLDVIKFDRVYVCYWDTCNNGIEDFPANWELTYIDENNKQQVSDGLDKDTPHIYDKWGTSHLLKDVLENLYVYIIEQ